MKKALLTIGLLVALTSILFSQKVLVEGYVFETNNRGYLNQVKVEAFENEKLVEKVYTNKEGKFSLELPQNKNYNLKFSKDIFHPYEQSIKTELSGNQEKVFIKIEMKRQPGYIFDVTLAEKNVGQEEVAAISGARIEIFNNTKQKEELVLDNHPLHVFSYTFTDGNHYTVLIRKKGFFTKRLEAYVNVDGCIMCFDGIDELEQGAPPVADNLAESNTLGTLVANVELEPLQIDGKLAIDNIYYNYNSAELRPDAKEGLDKVIYILETNPEIVAELGSHTDSRGSDAYNLKLSQDRAKSAVDYILKNSRKIDRSRLSSAGYGEGSILNKCKNGVKCPDWQHTQNRRTELRITGIRDESQNPWANLSLAQIIQEEKMAAGFDESTMFGGVVQVPEGATLEQIVKENEEKQAAIEEETETVSLGADYFNQSTSKPIESPIVEKSKPMVAESTAMTNHEVPVTEPISRPQVIRDSNTDGVIIPQQSGYTMVRPPKSIPQGYEGYKVEILSSPAALDKNHYIFQRHGNIHVDRQDKSNHSYMIGDFPTEASANNFLKKVIIERYPEARVIRYANGKRV